MKKAKTIFACLLCALLATSSAACSTTQITTSQESEASVFSQEESKVSEESSEASSEKPSSESSEESSRRTAADGSGTTSLPGAEVGSKEFQTAFAENPIDAAYDEDSMTAVTQTEMLSAMQTATQRWQKEIDIAYQEALDAGGDTGALKSAQDEWVGALDGEIQKINDEANTGDSYGALAAASEVMLFYRKRASELCEIVYSEKGELPDFEAAMNAKEEPKG